VLSLQPNVLLLAHIEIDEQQSDEIVSPERRHAHRDSLEVQHIVASSGGRTARGATVTSTKKILAPAFTMGLAAETGQATNNAAVNAGDRAALF
jgi:hypothetical protein